MILINLEMFVVEGRGLQGELELGRVNGTSDVGREIKLYGRGVFTR